MDGGLLSSPQRVAAVVNVPVVSISRAGRNESIQSAKNVTAAMTSSASPKTMSVYSSAAAVTVWTNGGSDPKALASQHYTEFDAAAFGSGGMADSGLRRELCSSPRIHPAREEQARREYEADRRLALARLAREVPKLNLIDVDVLSPEAREVIVSGRSPRREEDFAIDGANPLGDDDALARAAAALSDSAEEPPSQQSHTSQQNNKVNKAARLAPIASGATAAAAAPSPKGGGPLIPQPPPKKAAAAFAGSGSPRGGGGPVPAAAESPQTIGPTEPGQSPFRGPNRWQQPKPSPVPPVGHYRPKYSDVERKPTGGVILPIQASTPRETTDHRRMMPHALPPLSARALAAPISPTSGSPLSGTANMESGTLSNRGGTADADTGYEQSGDHTKHRGLPHPDRYSTSAFKCKIPICDSIYRSSAAPDSLYWPRNDLATMGSPRGAVSMEKQTPRPMEPRASEAPDLFYPLQSTLESRGAVAMARTSPRAEAKPADAVASVYYNVLAALAASKPAPPSVYMDRQTPRSTGKQPPAATDVSTDHIDHEKMHTVVEKRVRGPDLDRLVDRVPQGKVEGHRPGTLDLVYDTVETQTTPRVRVPVIRTDAVGHQDFMIKSITDKCDYKPDLGPIRPNYIRDVNFGVMIARRPDAASLMDVTYDTDRGYDTISPRVKGDPRIGHQLTREKRDKILTPRQQGCDIVYSPKMEVTRSREDTGACDFSKSVPREDAALGRGQPSPRWLAAHPISPGPGSYDVR